MSRPPHDDFDDFFTLATGKEPYAYQRELGLAAHPPSVLDVPTGLGKTAALIVSWLYGRRVHGRGPRRLVYALPMRTLVEQTGEVATKIRERLGIEPTELPIQTLMGGAEPRDRRQRNGDWQLHPEQDQVLVGTIDMLLSRALNRGYAESRFGWPISFGLLNSDCRWIFDEVQLMGPARATSAQLDGLRAKLGTALPCETIWASATVDENALATVDRPQLGTVVKLADDDRRVALAERLEAPKTLARVDISRSTPSTQPRLIAETALEHHRAGERTLVVLNRVDRAQQVHEQLAKLSKAADSPSLILLHSRFRPGDRAAHLEEVMAPPAGPGAIVVATQVIEAGVDLSSATLITETAPFSSIVQRLGRCNRDGKVTGGATVVWLDGGSIADDVAGKRRAAPYAPADLERAREALLMLEGESLSPAALERITVEESRDDPAILRRRDLLDLFDTSPDLSGTDIDIAPFIRDDDERSITVFFRALGDKPEPRIGGKDELAPAREELVQVPLASLDADRDAWLVDHLDGRWVRARRRDVPPGAVVLLNASDGGYSPAVGWNPKLMSAVEPVTVDGLPELEGFGDDQHSSGNHPQELLPHLQEVADEALTLARELGLKDSEQLLYASGALHDLGKAHHVYQRAMQRLIDPEGKSDPGEVLWAKSGTQGKIAYERPYFRHELPSVLAVRAIAERLELQNPTLLAYLIAAHHGKIRLSIRPAPGESRPPGAPDEANYAVGVVDGDQLPPVATPLGMIAAPPLDLTTMELGAPDSWVEAVIRLRDDPELGPFRLGFLEALLRMADWRASGA